MLAPNGKIYQLTDNVLIAAERVRYMLLDSFEDLEYSAVENKAVCFELTEEDIAILHIFYTDSNRIVAKFERLISELLVSFQFIFRLKAAYMVAGTNRFYCTFILDLDAQTE